MKIQPVTILALHLGLAAAVAQPVITNQPQWQTNIIGTTVAFTVGASGTPPLLYQWRKGSADLASQTSSTLVLTNLQVSQQGLYSVVVSNLEASVTSSNARLYVWGANYSGQLGIGTSDSERNTPQLVQPNSTWKAIAAGGYHTLAIREDGTLWSWGDNRFGQLGILPDLTPTRLGPATDWGSPP